MWAADQFIKTCIQKLQEAAQHQWLTEVSNEDKQYMWSKLSPLLSGRVGAVQDYHTSAKASVLIRYLQKEYRPELTAIIFTKRRSTAWGLAQLLTAHPDMAKYKIFSFVGATNSLRQSLVDLADMQVQNESLGAFRLGKKNICIATQVMEEGVDVQAMNLVIRYDSPETFRSMVQSRGRARRPDSKFVMFEQSECSDSSNELWQELESEMERQYMDDTRMLAEREANEKQDETGGLTYRIEATGAMLTFNNARAHLEHFCSTLSRSDSETKHSIRPVFLLGGEPGLDLFAKVILPTCLSANLQVTRAKSLWHTEKMALKDASFQAYKKLHQAGLVNDNLLPPPKEKTTDESTIEGRESAYQVATEFDPWIKVLGQWESGAELYPHRIELPGCETSLLMILPCRLQSCLAFPLYMSSSQTVSAILRPLQALSRAYPLELARDITTHLLQSVLGRRLKAMDVGVKNLPYLVVPEVNDLQAWYEQVKAKNPLVNVAVSCGQAYLIRYKGEQIPYICKPYRIEGRPCHLSSESKVRITRLTRRLDFHRLPKDHGDPRESTIAAGDCYVEGLPVSIAQVVLLVPSISNVVEIALRAQQAIDAGPLSVIGYKDLSLAMCALTAPSASMHFMYERLEFIGDTILKFWTTLGLFVDYPLKPESQLTFSRSVIINNARLQRVVREKGLEAYITTTGFSGVDWTLRTMASNSGTIDDKPITRRKLSSKTLADVLEALLGAAWIDGGRTGSCEADQKALTVLQLFFPELEWRTPAANVSHFTSSLMVTNVESAHLLAVEQMIGYTFKNKSLIVEALTQTSISPGQASLERLEWLGDAVIDCIVNTVLYDSPLHLRPEQMTLNHHALVNQHIFSFFAFELHHCISIIQPRTDPVSKETVLEREERVVRLNDYVRRADAAEARQHQGTFGSWVAFWDTADRCRFRGCEAISKMP